MKYVIIGIEATISSPARDYDKDLELVPASGILHLNTSDDGLTEEIELSAQIPWTAKVPETIGAELSLVRVTYQNEEAGTTEIVSFGSAELPVRFTLEERSTRVIKCKYTGLK